MGGLARSPPAIIRAKTYTRGESHEQPSRRDGRSWPGDQPDTAFGMARRVRNAIRGKRPGLAAVVAWAPLFRPGGGPGDWAHGIGHQAPTSRLRQGRWRGTAGDRRPRARRLAHPRRRGPRPSLAEDGASESLGDA